MQLDKPRYTNPILPPHTYEQKGLLTVATGGFMYNDRSIVRCSIIVWATKKVKHCKLNYGTMLKAIDCKTVLTFEILRC